MAEQVTTALIAILLVGGYLLVLQISSEKIFNRQMLPVLAAIELILYSLVVGAVIWLYFSLGENPLIIFGSLLIVGLVSFVFLLGEIIHNWNRIHKYALILFVVYVICVCNFTMLGRESNSRDVILVIPFQRMLQQMQKGNNEILQHVLLNVAMMIPLGVLIPLIHEKLNKFSYAFLGGMMVSIGIETIQLLFRLGECDVDDIIANTLGAVIGYLICSFVLKYNDAHRYSR